MARFDPMATNFVSGEVSKHLIGRIDVAKYANSVDTLENYLIMLLGGATRRPGTRYIAETKNSGVARLMPFQYSADQDYVIEIGDKYMRFFSNNAETINITSLDTYTSLLLHFNGTDGATSFIDEKGNAVTAYGNTQIDTAYKQFGTGSGLFDGSGDYLTVNNPSSIGTGDFTVDCWIRLATVASGKYEIIDSGGNFRVMYRTDSGAKFEIMCGSTTTNFTTTLSVNTWYHIAVVRSSGSLNVYVNGVGIGAQSNSGSVGNSTIYIGKNYSVDSEYFNGWIDELRISTKARWTANFTAPTSEYTINETLTELVSPYLAEDIFRVRQAHKNDIKWLTHGDYYPRKLSRLSATSFSIDTVDFVRGPFLDENTTTTTITPSAASGSGITLTASASIFDALHVGSLWRINSSSSAGAVVKITAVASGTSATADVQAEPDGSAGNIGGTGAYTTWAEGAFSAYRGYPSVCAFHQGRLYYACTEYEPQKIWGSVLYEYDNFEEGTDDDSAVTFEIATEERNAIQWLASGSKALGIGTTGGTFSAYGSNYTTITPSDIQINRDTNYGAAFLPSKRISSFTYYIQRNLHKVRELSYYYDYDVTRAIDMTLLAEHILRDGEGVIDVDYQQSPYDRLWCVRADGQLAVLTRNPEQDATGWSRIIAGIDSTTNGKFESVCVIPKSEADDQVWVIVNRKINGVTKRFIEVFTPEVFTDEWDSVCLDSSLTMDNPVTVSGATKANPVVITAVAHGFSNGDQVRIDNVEGMTELNGEEFLVANKTDDTFELTDLDGVNINGTSYSTYISGGEVRKMYSTVSGLSHLEGETVQVQMDGTVPTSNSFVVTSGAITLPEKAAVIHVGLPYTPYLKTLRPEGGSQVGTAQGKVKRATKVGIRFYKTRTCKVGTETTQDPITFDELYTGDKDIPMPMGWEKEGQLVITTDEPLPITVLGIMPHINVNEDI